MSSPTPTTGDSPSGTASSMPTCTTAIPGKYGEVPPDACNSQWAFHPDFAANLAWAVLMGLTACVHLIQAVFYKKVRPQSELLPSALWIAGESGLTKPCVFRDIAGCFSWVLRGRLRLSHYGPQARGISSS